MILTSTNIKAMNLCIPIKRTIRAMLKISVQMTIQIAILVENNTQLQIYLNSLRLVKLSQ